MKYLGKKKLYNFLVENGYTIPKMKEMEYRFYRGVEWLETRLEENDVELYCDKGRSISVYVYQRYESESGESKRKQIECSRYVDGNCVYRRNRNGVFYK